MAAKLSLNKIPKRAVSMKEQDPLKRKNNFNEVPLGYSAEDAIQEAKRCLDCKNKPCVKGCPVNINIPAFLKKTAEGDFCGALEIIRETNSLPAVCGRVCPQETQCQKFCTLGKVKDYESVAIGRIERFVADYVREKGMNVSSVLNSASGKKAAVIGAGPAGLTAAGELAKLGHDVTVFDAFSDAGGVLLYGIPEFRLPKEVVRFEVQYLKKLGVKFEFNCLAGKTVTIDDLRSEGFEAFFMGTGAGLPRFMGVEGEDLPGVMTSNEFLTRVNMMRGWQADADTPVPEGSNCLVVGGGNVALDAARTALRLGFDSVKIAYRRTKEEMPARLEEIHHGEEEGVLIDFLTLPVRFLSGEDGHLKTCECVRMELADKDQSGRARPVEIKGSNFFIETDLVIIAIGSSSNKILTDSEPGIETSKGYIKIDAATQATTLKGVFAGGDAVTGAATVIEAMGAGRKAAAAMHKYLSSGIIDESNS